MTEPPLRLQIPPGLDRHMRYPKFAGPRPRLLVLEGGYWVDHACVRAAGLLGWPVAAVPVPMEGALDRPRLQELLTALPAFRPDFILSVNMAGVDRNGLLVRLFEDLEVPFVPWFVDDPRTILMDTRHFASPWAAAVTWEEAYEGYLQARGFRAVMTLPLAADTTLFDAGPPEAWDQPAAFVGNSMVEPAARALESVQRFNGLEAAIAHAFDADRVTRDRFGLGLEAVLGSDATAALDAEAKRAAELYLFCEGTRRLRAALAAALVPDGLAIYGDAGWAGTVPQAGPPVPYHDGLAAFYRGTAVNLNVTSLQMATAPNQRVFDCPAAGGFLLTDRQTALEDLFDVGAELVCYDSFAECRELMGAYLRDHGTRRRVVEAGRRRILAEHTYQHRLRRLVGWLQSLFGD